MLSVTKKLCNKPWEGSYLLVWEEESHEPQGSHAHRALDPWKWRTGAANPVPAAASGTSS